MKPVADNQNLTKPISTPDQSQKIGFCSKIYNQLFHEDLYFRIGGFLILGLLLFLVVWAFWSFAENIPFIGGNDAFRSFERDLTGSLRNSFIVKKLFFKSNIVSVLGPWGDKTFKSVWNIFSWKIKVGNLINVVLLMLKYFVSHLVFVFIFIFLLNLFKVGRWSLSMVYFIFYTILWGTAVGLNAIPFPYGANPVSGSLILFARFGLWNWFSYMLLLISTNQFAWIGTSSWMTWDCKQLRKFPQFGFTPEQREIFIYGLLFLLASCLAEANIFVHYNSSL